jgi:hypothetical protein
MTRTAQGKKAMAEDLKSTQLFSQRQLVPALLKRPRLENAACSIAIVQNALRIGRGWHLKTTCGEDDKRLNPRGF